MIHKFKVGDRVKVVKHGSGVGSEDVGTIVSITDCGRYSTQPGYKVFPKIGNSATNLYSGYCGEISFETVGELFDIYF